MVFPSADRSELPRRWVRSVAPTGDGAVSLYSTRVVIRGAHGDELALGWCCLTISIAAPAGNDAVGLYPARVVIRRANGGKLTSRGCGFLVKTIITPADDQAVPLYAARVSVPRVHVHELPGRRHGLAIAIGPPTCEGVIGLHSARVINCGANSGEGCRGASRSRYSPALRL